MIEPISRGFILGSRRSGSNLLRVMLNSSPHLAAPHPPHILHAFTPLLPLYGDLADDTRWHRLVTDVTCYTNLSPVPLLDSGEALLESKVAGIARQRSLTSLHDAIYGLIMAANGKRAWACKSNDNIHYLDTIEAAFGDTARYIFLVRDGRDVALSFRKAPIGPKHPYVCAEEWDQAQRRMLAWRAQVRERCLLVRYERLLESPETVLREICALLEVPFDPGMIDYYRSDEAQRTATRSVLWSNLSKPLLGDNAAKWRTDAADNVRQFERLAHDTLVRLGYGLSGPPMALPDPDELARIRSEDAWQRTEVREAIGADGGNRDAQAAFLAALRGGSALV